MHSRLYGVGLTITICILAACSGPAVSPPVAASAIPTPSLAKAWQGQLLIGAAVDEKNIKSQGELIANQFSSVVAENAMKPMATEPREGEFHFEAADAIVRFAQSHDMAIRGHTLLWHLHTPDWMWQGRNGQPADRNLVLARLKRHIETEVGHYKGQVYVWDVVNEIIDEKQADCLRNDKWHQVVGPDYVDEAFRYAHAADPAARLFINEYSTTEPAKQRCLIRVVQGLQARGVPINGIGHQMHISVFYPRVEEIDQTLTAFARLGLENQITEIDMSLYKWKDNRLYDTRENLLALQARRYGDIMRMIHNHPDVTAVTWWGVTDASTWLNQDAPADHHDQPLLFDAQGQPKGAFWAVFNAARR
ncbi:endo-1,4-beta-xylanase [Silvimonas terrae]|uniref:Beta-xylanase n=1 Tax=Silvimonas terrae TaxID=300266 RepID=A0A840RBB9_9NEIS|nr:endo-1,4-beta-xylanase [Silvimonas terrae]MBB5189632.1 endo-1,4-beta-xylanase [Silvimonas terrae]